MEITLYSIATQNDPGSDEAGVDFSFFPWVPGAHQMTDHASGKSWTFESWKLPDRTVLLPDGASLNDDIQPTLVVWRDDPSQQPVDPVTVHALARENRGGFRFIT